MLLSLRVVGFGKSMDGSSCSLVLGFLKGAWRDLSSNLFAWMVTLFRVQSQKLTATLVPDILANSNASRICCWVSTKWGALIPVVSQWCPLFPCCSLLHLSVLLPTPPVCVAPYSTCLCCSLLHQSVLLPTPPVCVAPYYTSLCCSLLHLSVLLPTPPVCVAPYYTCLCCSLLHLSVLLPTTPFCVAPYHTGGGAVDDIELERRCHRAGVHGKHKGLCRSTWQTDGLCGQRWLLMWVIDLA